MAFAQSLCTQSIFIETYVSVNSNVRKKKPAAHTFFFLFCALEMQNIVLSIYFESLFCSTFSPLCELSPINPGPCCCTRSV